ncbi:MAG TPA: NAD(P)-dependent oxidoreductase [Burkholderiaceae bacterium]|jgi:2-hydroxy-3-oxopropionate reductase|nr:NAD(P)-dependent oxidoreductase [Burkholderiaceae bacterium]
MKVAVLGIGLMGFPMARRLCEAGFTVHAWNRSPDKAQRLAAFGAQVHGDLKQAVAQSDVVVSLLEHGDAVADVLFEQGAAAAMRTGTLMIDMASIRPDQARDHAARLAAYGVAHLDAPVSGGTIGAEQGTLAIMAGGEPADFERAAPVFAVLGRATLVGGHGSGQLAKLANQMIVGITIGAVAEALLLCEKSGVDPVKVMQALAGGAADSRILRMQGQRMADRDFEARARMTVQLKDLRNALASAGDAGISTPITEVVAQLFSDGVADGLAGHDHSAVFLALERRKPTA